MKMVNQETVLTFTLLITVLSSIKADNSTQCLQTCGVSNWVQYPFGFSVGCPIRLNCTAEEIRIGQFKVEKVTEDSILINLPANCSRKIGEIEQLFGSNYGLTWNNELMLQKCKSAGNGCVIPARLGLQNCDGNISCYSMTNNNGSDFMSFKHLNASGCDNLFTSVAWDMRNGSDKNAAVSLRLHAAELGWWLRERQPHNCSEHADPVNVKVSGGLGYRCKCKDGFEGDGFADGDGCRRVLSIPSVPHCSVSKYMSGQCGGSGRIRILIAGIIAGALLMAGFALICYCLRRRSNSLRNRSANRLLCEAAGSSSIPFYPYREIERATNSFSEKQRLGTGAYGTVYAGKLHNDELVAIKKIRHRDADGVEQVMNEIKLLSSVSHPNLVRLLGCCIENGEQILVYEYMPNGTLSQHLQRENGMCLPWTVRLTIATETAHAIAYLHSAMNPPIYHRDIKSSNILLDFNFNSKVADFGLSRLGMPDDSHISTAPQGTPGYVDPQYHQNFHLSDKSDVYSFGVVLVEIITALKVVDFSRPHSEVNLAALAIDKIGKGRLDEIIDLFLEPNRDAWTLSSIHKVAELAFRCLAFHRDMRPSMMEVANELEQIRLSGWAPLDENICMASSVASSCSSPYNGSEKSFGGVSVKKAGGVGSRRLVVPQRLADCLTSLEEVKDCSPVSVQDPWLSGQSSPSTNSLLGNVVQ